MAQWVKNPPAVAEITAELCVLSPFQSRELKDLKLPQLWHRAVHWIQFPTQEFPYNMGMAIKRKKKNKVHVVRHVFIIFS